MPTHLHIVTSELPNAVDNSQTLDAYFLIKSLHQQKISIHLHCLSNDFFEPTPQMNEICETINYYERDLSKISFKLDLPYHVSTRSSNKLRERLNQDDFPILFMGLTSSFAIYDNYLSSERKTAIRLSKNESVYFQQLSSLVPWKGKKLHYQVEAWRMNRYFKRLISQKTTLFTSSKKLHEVLKQKTENHTQWVPLFTGMPAVFHQSNKGHFCLFHGKLSNEETAYAAFWLLEHVFHTLEIPFVIAGSNPSTHLENAAHVRQHTCLVTNPGEKEMQELIKKAQIILSPTFIEAEGDDNLLQSLALGRHILINSKRSKDKEIKSVCHIAQSPEEFIQKTKELFETEFSEEEKYARQQLLNNKFQDQESLGKLLSWIS
ncbi:MAG: hypothetical protein RL000_159 [Bacteroidota bacterium]|jgi:hypothetical protein